MFWFLGFRGFPADGDASANATTSILSRLVVVPARELIRFLDIIFVEFFSFYLFISRSRWSSMGLMFGRFGYLAVSFEFKLNPQGYFHIHGRGNQFEGAYSFPAWHYPCSCVAYMVHVMVQRFSRGLS